MCVVRRGQAPALCLRGGESVVLATQDFGWRRTMTSESDCVMRKRSWSAIESDGSGGLGSEIAREMGSQSQIASIFEPVARCASCRGILTVTVGGSVGWANGTGFRHGRHLDETRVDSCLRSGSVGGLVGSKDGGLGGDRGNRLAVSSRCCRRPPCGAWTGVRGQRCLLQC